MGAQIDYNRNYTDESERDFATVLFQIATDVISNGIIVVL